MNRDIRSAASAGTQGDDLLVVFYDGSCPLCRREINHYMGLNALKTIDWQDISAESHTLSPFGISREQAMKRFHVIDERGTKVSGVRAFLTLWRHLPGYRHLARLVEYLHLTPVLEVVYRRFARYRYRRSCQGRGQGQNPCPRQ